MKNDKSLDDYLLLKTKSRCKGDSQKKEFISNLKMQFSDFDFSLEPSYLLNSLIKDFPSGIELEDFDHSIKICVCLDLLAELKVDSEIIEEDIILFTKNKIIPRAYDFEEDYCIQMLESVTRCLSEIGTKRSLHLIEVIVSNSIIEKSGSYTQIVSACLSAYKNISDRELLDFFVKHYPKIKDHFLFNKEGCLNKTESFEKSPMGSLDEKTYLFYSYLLQVNEVLYLKEP